MKTYDAIVVGAGHNGLTNAAFLAKAGLTTERFVGSNAVIGFLARNIDYWIVGRLGVRALGVYYIAYVLPNVLKRRLALAGTEVMFPILSRITDERERFGRAFLDATRFITIAGFPMMFGLAAVADAVVVGSALVGRIPTLLEQPERIAPELAGVLAGMRAAMDADVRQAASAP